MGMGRIASSGMDASMQEMDVISNNIANQGTTGFKQSNINFADLFPSNATPTSVGMGVDVSSVQQDFSAEQAKATGINSNMAINGSGFFVVSDQSTGALSYSRNGAFVFNSETGLLTLNGNQVLQGFPAVNGTIPSGSVASNLVVSTNSIPAVASTAVTQTGLNLSSTDSVPVDSPFNATDSESYNFSSTSTIYDSLGNKANATFYYVKSPTANNWTMYASVNGTVINSGSPTTLTFNTSGAITAPAAPVSLSFSPTTGASSPQAFTVSFANSTQNAGKDNPGTFTADGSAPGVFTGITIDSDGKLSATYSSGPPVLQGQVALATFPNPQALTYMGNAAWTATTNAGTPTVSPNNSTANITSDAIEDSNVNVAQQLVDLISAQNAFQANAQAEQVYSQVMQTVTKL